MEFKDYKNFFKRATGLDNDPYPYQERLATTDSFPELLDIPTGLGKTAAVVLAWLWRRRFDARFKKDTPRRLVYCLPMRVLVEQTHRSVVGWLANLGEYAEEPSGGKVSVHLLMGGEEDLKSWTEWPEADMILIGTQDMLLSRALMRGYSMSRYQWPVHFALLHNHALWVFDEVQLMGPGLATSVQLQLFHEKFWKSAIPCRFFWTSATLGDGIFNTRDRRDHDIERPGPEKTLDLSDPKAPERSERVFKAEKSVRLLEKSARPHSTKTKDGILDIHKAGCITLVIMNTVPAAQALYQELQQTLNNDKKATVKPELILLHGRMRPCDRIERMNLLLGFIAKQQSCKKQEDWDGVVRNHPGIVVVSTQVIEAGVDISARYLWSEIAPWSSVIQRMGRLNRDGYQNDVCAFFWMPKADKEENSSKDRAPNAGRIGPYDKAALDQAEELLKSLSAHRKKGLSYRQALETTINSKKGKEASRVTHKEVIRPHDFFDLFSTEPDLAGGFTDISRFVRDTDNDADVQVFWGDFKETPPNDLDSNRNILCRVPAYVLRKFLTDAKGRAWVWDPELRTYKAVSPRDVRPGMTLLLSRMLGGYDSELGWTGKAKDQPNAGLAVCREPSALDDDRWSETDWLLLPEHLRDARAEAEKLAKHFDLPREWKASVVCASLWHDVGKSHPRWQAPLSQKAPGQGLWAKFKGVKPFNPRLRHEAASALAAWQHWLKGESGLTALAVYLIAAHHGKVRTVLRTTRGKNDVFGIKEGETLPALPGWYNDDIPLDLSPKLFASPGYWEGDTYYATMPSWIAVVSQLLGGNNRNGESASAAIPNGEPQTLGPFALAFLEALVIVADHRASASLGSGGKT